ncbi:MAG TPA: hypothetical protein VND23_10640 [Acidimicrobiales bacterium]|nr:hypothetical protein [Acidimicrobiales bacterium]
MQEVWFLAWIEHAIRHGVNPFLTAAINYPHGVNLAVNTSMPLLGLLAAPVTALHGPVAAYNVMLRVGFASSAMSMCLVLRRVALRWPAAFVGGLTYGFSPYMIGQGNGHLFLVFAPLPPLMLLSLYELCRQAAPAARRWGLVLGVSAVGEYFISIEALVATAVCAAVGLAVAVALAPGVARSRLPGLLRGVAWAVALFVPLVAFPTYEFLFGPQHISGPPHAASALAEYRVDLLGPVVPTVEQRFAPAGIAAHGTSFVAGNVGENGIYLGVPLAAVLVALVLWMRRDRLVLVVSAIGIAGFLLALGTPLTVDGHDTGVPMPFAVLVKLPILDGLLPARFSFFTQLAAAFVLATGVDRLVGRAALSRRPRHAMLALVGALALVLAPLVPRVPYPWQPTAVPAYITSAQAAAIPRGSVVLTYPYDFAPYNDAMLWQALSDMRFRIIGGEATRRGPDGAGTSSVDPLAPTELQNLFRAALLGSASAVPAPPMSGLGLRRVRTFFTRWHVGTVIVDPVGADPALAVSYLTVALRRAPVVSGGVDVWYHVAP